MQKNIIKQNFSHEITGILLLLLNNVTNNEREIVNLENKIKEQIKSNMDNIELSTVDRPELGIVHIKSKSKIKARDMVEIKIESSLS